MKYQVVYVVRLYSKLERHLSQVSVKRQYSCLFTTCQVTGCSLLKLLSSVHEVKKENLLNYDEILH